MELWELVAREQIRGTMATYNWSGDAFRLADLAAAFCEDGVLEVRGEEPKVGREAIVGYLSGGTDAGSDEDRRAARQAEAATSGLRQVVRHNVTNIRFVEVTEAQAQVSSYFTVLTEKGLDHFGRYRDTFVPAGDRWLIRHRFVSTDWHAPYSTMVRRYLTS